MGVDLGIGPAIRAPARSLSAANGAKTGCSPISRTRRRPARNVAQSFSVARKFWRMRTGTRGSAEASSIWPRLSGRSSTARQPKLSA